MNQHVYYIIKLIQFIIITLHIISTNKCLMMDSYFIVIFRSFGLNLVAKEGKYKQKIERRLKLISIFFMCFVIFMMILQYLIRSLLYYNKDLIGQATDWVQLILPVLSYLVIVCEANWKKQVQENLNKRMYSIQEKVKHDQKHLIRILVKYFLMMNGVCVMSEILIILLSTGDIKWRNNNCYKAFSLIAVRLSDFQFIFYVLQLTQYLKSINKNLSKTQRYEISTRYCRRLKNLAEIVNEIWMLHQLLNLRFGLSLFSTVTSNFLIFTSSSYWIAYKLITGYNNTNYAIASISFIISPVVNLTVLFYCCYCCTSEVK